MIEEIENNINLLTKGWTERVEYGKPVKYHRGQCNKTEPCECPLVSEKRVKSVPHPGLLEQLRKFQQWGDKGAEPRAERTAPNKPGSRPNADAGFFALDEITVEAYSFYDRIASEAGRDRTLGLQNVDVVLNGLPYQLGQIQGDYPHLVRDALAATRRWVNTAERTLGLKTSEVTFKNTSCGECSGPLVVGRDLHRTDVRCVDCGNRYRMNDWMKLYEGGHRAP
jgi:hypothetical protein